VKPLTTEFDITVLTVMQLRWLLDRAQNHHFDTAILDKINDEGAWITTQYDDGLLIHFFVTPEGVSEFLGINKWEGR
jgi:hypothetical protein